MKLSLIILFFFTLNCVFSQTIDSAIAVFSTDRKEWFVKEHNTPSWMIDGVYVTSGFYTIITGLYPSNDTILTNQGRIYYCDGVRWTKRSATQ